MVREYRAPNNNWWSPEDRAGEYVVIYPNGTKSWHKDGKRHRTDGPAYTCPYGTKDYWYEGKIYLEIQSDEEWKELLRLRFLW